MVYLFVSLLLASLCCAVDTPLTGYFPVFASYCASSYLALTWFSALPFYFYNIGVARIFRGWVRPGVDPEFLVGEDGGAEGPSEAH